MYRLYHEQKPGWMFAGTPFLSLKDKAPFMWESQMAFRNDSTELYNEGSDLYSTVRCSTVLYWTVPHSAALY